VKPYLLALVLLLAVGCEPAGNAKEYRLRIYAQGHKEYRLRIYAQGHHDCEFAPCSARVVASQKYDNGWMDFKCKTGHVILVRVSE
jgi:hypothetical protein